MGELMMLLNVIGAIIWFFWIASQYNPKKNKPGP